MISQRNQQTQQLSSTWTYWIAKTISLLFGEAVRIAYYCTRCYVVENQGKGLLDKKPGTFHTEPSIQNTVATSFCFPHHCNGGFTSVVVYETLHFSYFVVMTRLQDVTSSHARSGQHNFQLLTLVDSYLRLPNLIGLAIANTFAPIWDEDSFDGGPMLINVKLLLFVLLDDFSITRRWWNHENDRRVKWKKRKARECKWPPDNSPFRDRYLQPLFNYSLVHLTKQWTVRQSITLSPSPCLPITLIHHSHKITLRMLLINSSYSIFGISFDA